MTARPWGASFITRRPLCLPSCSRLAAPPPGGDDIPPSVNPATPLVFVANLFSPKSEAEAFFGIHAALRAADPGAGAFLPREKYIRTTFTTTVAAPTPASMASAAIVLALALRADVGRWVAKLDDDDRAGILEWRAVRPGNRPAARAAALQSAQAAMVAALARKAAEEEEV